MKIPFEGWFIDKGIFEEGELIYDVTYIRFCKLCKLDLIKSSLISEVIDNLLVAYDYYLEELLGGGIFD